MSATTHRLCEGCYELCTRHGRLGALVVHPMPGNALCCGCSMRHDETNVFHLASCPDFFICQGFHEGEELTPANPAPVVIR